MKNLQNLPEVWDVNLWLTDSRGNGHRVPLLNDDEIDLRQARYVDEAQDVNGNSYHLVRYTLSDDINRLCAIENPEEPAILPADLYWYDC